MNTILRISIVSEIERINLELHMYKVQALTDSDYSDGHVFRLEYIHGDIGEIRRTILIKTYDGCYDADIIMYERKENSNRLMKFFTSDNVNLSITG